MICRITKNTISISKHPTTYHKNFFFLDFSCFVTFNHLNSKSFSFEKKYYEIIKSIRFSVCTSKCAMEFTKDWQATDKYLERNLDLVLIFSPHSSRAEE
jgi:hypothetical protein